MDEVNATAGAVAVGREVTVAGGCRLRCQCFRFGRGSVFPAAAHRACEVAPSVFGGPDFETA
jgi:hypothetical protein